MMETTRDLTRIDRTIRIDAAPEKVWRALTDAAELSAWFQVRIEGEVAPDREVWMTTLNPEWAGQRFRVRFVEMDRPRRFIWLWHPGEVDPAVDYDVEPRTTVTFTLEPEGGGTKLTVSETGFEAISLARRAKVFGDNEQGWTEVIVWIKRHVEAKA